MIMIAAFTPLILHFHKHVSKQSTVKSYPRRNTKDESEIDNEAGQSVKR